MRVGVGQRQLGLADAAQPADRLPRLGDGAAAGACQRLPQCLQLRRPADEVRVGLGQVVLGDGRRRPVRHAARARRRLPPAEARQVDDDAFGRTVAGGAPLGIATWVGERKAGHPPRRRGRGIGHAPGADRTGDVLERELAQVLEAEVELAADLVVHLAGDADTAWLGPAFQPGGDVDPVAVDVLALDDHVADVDADPKPDALGRGQVQLAPGHAVLDRHRAGDRLDDGSELAQGAVARQVDDPAAGFGRRTRLSGRRLPG